MRTTDLGCQASTPLAGGSAGQPPADEVLRWTEETFRSVVESVTDYALVLLDPDGRVVTWNSGAQRIFGYRAEDSVGQHFSRFYPHQDVASGAPQRDLTVAIDNGRLETDGWRLRQSGATFWAHVIATALRDQDGILRGFAELTMDLTESRRVEAKLTDAKLAAERASLEKSDFLSRLSHELLGPLNAILGFAQLMESDATPPTSAQKESLGQILQAGWQLLKLVDDVVDLVNIESGRASLSREPVSLAEVMFECRGMIEPLAQERGIQVVFPPFDIPFFVLADRTRLQQVYVNLLSNAIKYNMKRGMVEVTCAESPPERIRVSIRDTGSGLHPDQLAMLFQPFSRLGQEAGGEDGAGIGLVMAKQLVELMGGEIGVESTAGLGSVFWFELISVAEPVVGHEDGDAGASTHDQAPRDVPQRTLLSVEDNPANVKLIEQIIARRPDIRLLTAGNGASAVEVALRSRPDVILLDINLPDIDGFEVLRRLRSDATTAAIPVLAISANAMARDIKKALEAGFSRYLTKPIKVDELMAALDEAFATAQKVGGHPEQLAPSASSG